MKRVLRSVAMAIALVGFAGVTGCDKDAGDNDHADSTAMETGIDVDSSAAGGTEVSVDGDKDYTFEGTATGVSGDMVTINHEEIDGYKPAGTNSYKLADKEMAQYVEKGERMEFTMKVVGDQAMITAMETADIDDDDNDSAGVDTRENRTGDMDTIGSNRGEERPEGDESKVGDNDKKK
jgi:hypothetical protein